jgi:hypothetical protein
MTLEAQRLLAANPETAPEILRELSQSSDRATRQAVAPQSRKNLLPQTFNFSEKR